MALASGTRLGPYEIVAPIGAGGMGEVYRAHDTKLNRDVALKVLAAPFVGDADRLARLKREAYVLASLNHPHIAAIYGFEDTQDVHALVLELVEGPTLADRLQQGPIPVEEALGFARQIGDALEAAHAQGVIHRDLKPANIKLRPDGTVKVLDFGLAKAQEASTAVSAATMSPTITSPVMTGVGVILGTAAYMSPEQAKGKPADQRSDVWSFGCVLYEMLTGRRPFDGEDVSDTLAFVLTKEPDWTLLPPATPASVRRLLRRAMQKDRRRRLGDFGDVRLDIDDGLHPLPEPALAPADGSSRKSPRRLWIVGGAALIAGGLLGAVAVLSRSDSRPPYVTRFAFAIPEDQPFIEFGHQVVGISRDGRSIAYVANRRLYLRSLNDGEARPIAGTEMPLGQLGAPTFSPDGKSIAYLASASTADRAAPGSGADRSIRTVPTAGGVPEMVCDVCQPAGSLHWDEHGIVFVDPGTGREQPRILSVPASGGKPEVLASITGGRPLDAQLLPDGDHVLFTLAPRLASSDPSQVSPTWWDQAAVVVQSRTSGARKTIVTGGMAARYVASGHIVYARSGVLLAVPFDVRTLEVTGPAVPVVQGVRRTGTSFNGAAYFAISANGDLVYLAGPASVSYQYDLAVLDQRSGLTPLKLRPDVYGFPRVSPDGKTVAVDADNGVTANVYIYDLNGAAALRQLTSRGRNRFPVWSADGQSVSFQSDREGDLGIFHQPANGSRDAERLTRAASGVTHVPDAWSPDGRTLLFEEAENTNRVLKALSAPDKQVTSVADIHETYALDATFSRDGRFIAFRAPSRRSTVVVQPFPPTSARFLVDDGVYPVWSPDGKSLVFRRLTTGEFVVTDVATSTGFSFKPPRQLPKSFPERISNATRRNYDLLADGRLLGVVGADNQQQPGVPTFHVVLNWTEELKARVRAK